MGKTYRNRLAVTRCHKRGYGGYVKNELSELEAKEEGVQCKVRTEAYEGFKGNESSQVYCSYVFLYGKWK
jgi:hypothetical protein